ncbi:hypothetical protein E4U34_003447 [Claviceps purpurea]|nr:hypothetical protein E4U34_003447 [Claviceps purpurea]KAG6267277.1 hypothetical protein E4U47_005371 [Claviceps purpurea]
MAVEVHTESRGTTSRTRRNQETQSIEEAIAKSDAAFTADYLPSLSPDWKHPTSEIVYTLHLIGAAALQDAHARACFDLIDETSGADYRGSSLGWHPSAKMKEMRSPELRYILVLRDDQVCGFMSMMPTYENGEAVLYCYEIHLKTELKGSGLGKQLMHFLFEAGDRIQLVDKVMLTCFVSNKHARQFYERLGFEVDACSPRERKLRGGRIVMPDFVIMSRRTAGQVQTLSGKRVRDEID